MPETLELRGSELIAETAKNGQDIGQGNEETGWYTREFLYNIRDIEKLSPTTECPLTTDQLKSFRLLPYRKREKASIQVDIVAVEAAKNEQDFEQCNEDTGRCELLAKITKNEQDLDQCNEDTGWYNREFFYNIRDIEKFYSMTGCPLKQRKLMSLGLCPSQTSERQILEMPRKRAELLAEIAKNEQDPEQCNEKTGQYNRDFLYNVGELEKVCSITECPLTPHQLRGFGLCLSQLGRKRVMEIPMKRAALAKNEQDLDQCNEATGWYNRDFLYNVRDIEKLCSITACPLTSRQLKELGISQPLLDNRMRTKNWQNADPIRHARSKVTKSKRDLNQCNKDTGWYNREFLNNVRDLEKVCPTKCPVKCEELKNLGIYHRAFVPKKYTASRIKPYVSHIKSDEPVVLHKAEHPWKLEEINDDNDYGRKDVLIRQVRALLNKITTKTEESLTKEFLDYKVYNSPALEEIVSIIVNFALEEQFCELFTRMCYYQITEERDSGNGSAFQDALFYSLQKSLQFNYQREAETDPNKQIDSLKSLRRRWLGSVRFIDRLYLHGLISMRMDFVHGLLTSVIANCEAAPNRPDEASIEGSLILVGTIGHRLQAVNEAAAAECPPFPLDRLFSVLQTVKPFVGSRIRFMIDDVQDQRANGWKSMKAVREEAHRVAAASDKERLRKLNQYGPLIKQKKSQPQISTRWIRDEADASKESKIKFTKNEEWRTQHAESIKQARAIVAKTKKDLNQCNERIGWYNREFFYNVRDLGEVVQTKWPVKRKELMNLGIYRQAFSQKKYSESVESKVIHVKSDKLVVLQKVDHPSKLEEINDDNDNGKKELLISGETKATEDQPQISHVKSEGPVVLHKADRPWKLEKVKDTDDGWKELLMRRVRCVLNKITTKTEASLTKEFLGCRVYLSLALHEIVSIIINLAVEERFRKLFANMCYLQVIQERDISNSSTFQDALLSSLQKELQFADERKAETDSSKRIDSLDSGRRRFLGSVRFIDRLYLHGIISMRVNLDRGLFASVIANCEAAPNRPDEVLIEGALILARTLGHRPQAVNQPPSRKAKKVVAESSPLPLDRLFNVLQTVKPFVGSRIRSMIDSVQEQRANGGKAIQAVRVCIIAIKEARQKASESEKERLKKLNQFGAFCEGLNKVNQFGAVCKQKRATKSKPEISSKIRDEEARRVAAESEKERLKKLDPDATRKQTTITFSQPQRRINDRADASKESKVKHARSDGPVKCIEPKNLAIHRQAAYVPKKYIEAYRPNVNHVNNGPVILHRADRPWKLEKITDDNDYGRKEVAIRQVRAILNKITPSNENSLIKQFLEYNVHESTALREMVSIIVDFAQDESKYSKLIAKMCRSQITAELGVESEHGAVFQYALSAQVEQAFMQSNARLYQKQAEIEENKRIDSPESFSERRRNRRFGCVKFIGQLYLYGLIKFVIPSSFISSLLSSVADDSWKPDEDSVECALHLLRSAGYRLHKESGLEPGSPATVAAPFPFAWAFTVLREAKSLVSGRIRFMITSLEEQRADGWVITRKSTREGPALIWPRKHTSTRSK